MTNLKSLGKQGFTLALQAERTQEELLWQETDFHSPTSLQQGTSAEGETEKKTTCFSQSRHFTFMQGVISNVSS
uniref:Uncharacterized protein n=1 Tax=Anguilla anguilla TaxID=7936 RepID=A0A0E9WF14_ANGAN